jgi:aspartate kinase
VRIIVQKYGGTSVDGRERILAVAERVAALKARGFAPVVVVSAQGHTTDLLLEQAATLAAAPAQRELDMLMTAGERISMSLLAIALNSIGCPAVSFTGSQVGIITDTKHTDARILEVRPHRVRRELERGNVVVVGGFQGVSTEKEVTTLGRGGSDTTAVALAAALPAERCEILTDVDAVYTADPRRVDGARKIDEISYEDMIELARFGAVVLKEEAVRFAERAGIAVHVGSSTGETTGTIVLEKPRRPERPIVGMSLLPDVRLVSWDPAASPESVSLDDLAGRARFVMLEGDRALAALEGPVPGEEAGCRSLTGEPASVVSLVGPGAGAGSTAVRAIRAVGHDVLALCSSGRSTLVAVPRAHGEEALKNLHAVFFPPEEARSR